MSRYFYAQINQSNTVIAVSDLSGPIEAPDMIPIQTLDNFLIGKVWDGEKFTGNSYIEPEVGIMVPSQFFRNRFTNTELHNLYGSDDIQIKIWLDDLRLKMSVSIDDDLDAVFARMVQLGLITQQRSDSILQECRQYVA